MPDLLEALKKKREEIQQQWSNIGEPLIVIPADLLTFAGHDPRPLMRMDSFIELVDVVLEVGGYDNVVFHNAG
jgi:hypothetical protein